MFLYSLSKKSIRDNYWGGNYSDIKMAKRTVATFIENNLALFIKIKMLYTIYKICTAMLFTVED